MLNKQPIRYQGFALVLAALFPLVSAFYPISLVQIEAVGIHMPSEDLIAMAGAFVLTTRYFILPGYVPTFFKVQCRYLTGFFVLCLFSALLGNGASCASSLYLLVRMASYYYYANAVVGIAIKRKIDLPEFAAQLIKLFLLLASIIMLYNFLLYRVPFGTIRMQWPGIGAVITGCTAAAVIGFLLLRERNNNHDELSTIGILLLMLLALCTQSRSGIYVSFALVVYRFFPRHNAAFSLLCLLGLTTVLLAFDPIQYIADTRIGSFDSARFDTWQSAFEIFSESGLFGQLFGHGFGAVFPYVDWSSAYDRGEILRALTDGSWNQFVFHSHVMLVQPHNIFVYFLLEIGITGVALFLGYFVHLFVSARQYVSGAQVRRFGLLLVAVLLLNCFDSVFIINVASTFWWTLILLAFSGLVISVKEMAK